MNSLLGIGFGELDNFDVELQSAVTAEHNWNVENNPHEPYSGVAALFNGDLHIGDPSWAPREDWYVVNPYVIRHVKV